LGDLRVDGRIILKCSLKKLHVRVWTGSNSFRTGPVLGYHEYGTEFQKRQGNS